MAVPIVMPKLGQIMVEGVVNKWHKAAGEVVVEGEIIAEIEKLDSQAAEALQAIKELL